MENNVNIENNNTTVDNNAEVNNSSVENPAVAENYIAVESPSVAENNTVDNVFAASEPVVNNNENNAASEIVPNLNNTEVVENNNTNTSSEVNHNIKIVDIDGVEKEVELLSYFTLNSNNKKYVAYTDNNEDENGNVIISTAEVVEKEDNTIEFVSISEPAVLEEVKKVLLDLAK